jgi:hypothetical protein
MLIIQSYIMSLIVIRHSNREEIISSKVNGLTAKLTPEGMKNARIFGKQLKDKMDVELDYIITTFMKRCIDTGCLINSKHRSRTTIHHFNKEKSLVELGYVIPGKVHCFLDYFDKMIIEGINYPRMFNDLFEKNVISYSDCNEYGRRFISKFYLPTRNSLVVTHDTTVAPIMHFLSKSFNFPLEKDMIEPKPLCGFHFSIIGDRFFIDWIDFDKGINIRKLV